MYSRQLRNHLIKKVVYALYFFRYTRRMRSRGITRNQFRQISWMLIVALFVLTILPAHFHLHHPEHDNGHAHEHVVDLHVFPAGADAAHHQDAHILKASPDGVIKNLFAKFLPFLLLAVLLTCLAIPAARRLRRPEQAVLIPTCNRASHSPPLRGPPAPVL